MGDAACRHEGQGEIIEKRVRLRRQLEEVWQFRDRAKLYCECGAHISLLDAFKCFYCHIWFCRTCAKKHFE